MSCYGMVLVCRLNKKAKLLIKIKLILNSGLVKEVVIWQVGKDKNYPEGIKYRLILTDPIWKKTLLLFDNHAPKGHHSHDKFGREFIYDFISVDKLINDYNLLCLAEERKYENNEN